MSKVVILLMILSCTVHAMYTSDDVISCVHNKCHTEFDVCSQTPHHKEQNNEGETTLIGLDFCNERKWRCIKKCREPEKHRCLLNCKLKVARCFSGKKTISQVEFCYHKQTKACVSKCGKYNKT